MVDFHPRPQTAPTTAGEAFYGVQHGILAPPFRAFNLSVWAKQGIGENGYVSVAGKDAGFNHVRIDPNRPCPTVPKSCVFGGISGLSHWREPRALSIGELKRASSFPDAFRFVGGYEQAHNRIGNSVPPMFMRAVACHICDTLLPAFRGVGHD